MLVFKFRWRAEEITAARDLYRQNSAEMQRERMAFDSGTKIAAGHTEPENLGAIIEWKSSRPKRRIMTGNTADEIAEALRVAVSAKQARTAVGVLYGLNGVDVAMASAILTAIDPETYTVIDWRALNALGVKKSWLTVDDYLQYVGFCKAKAGELRTRLRDLDQALWVLGGT